MRGLRSEFRLLLLLLVLAASQQLRVFYDLQGINMRKLNDVLKQTIVLTSVLKQYREVKHIYDDKFVACCVAHKDNNPSMAISDDVGLWNCFACGAAGDIINMMRALDGMSYSRAVQRCIQLVREIDPDVRAAMDKQTPSLPSLLARASPFSPPPASPVSSTSPTPSVSIGGTEATAAVQMMISLLSEQPRRTGKAAYQGDVGTDAGADVGAGASEQVQVQVQVSREDIARLARERKRAFMVMQCASLYYSYRLLNDPGALHCRRYLQSRGISPATARRFQIGYAPIPFGPTGAGAGVRAASVDDLDNVHTIYRFSRVSQPQLQTEGRRKPTPTLTGMERRRINDLSLSTWLTTTVFQVHRGSGLATNTSVGGAGTSGGVGVGTGAGASAGVGTGTGEGTQPAVAFSVRLNASDLMSAGMMIERRTDEVSASARLSTSPRPPSASIPYDFAPDPAPRYNNKCYERFRNRLIVPIRDMQGSVIGFGARKLDTVTSNGTVVLARATKEAKYVNSPSTAVFKKGTVLFGMDVAAAQIRKRKFAVIVEGYFDVISAHELGIRNVVAALGTSITGEQMRLAASLSDSGRVVLLLDHDEAGDRAGDRAVKNLLKMGASAKGRKATPDSGAPVSATASTSASTSTSASATASVPVNATRVLLMGASLADAAEYILRKQPPARVPDALAGAEAAEVGTWTGATNYTALAASIKDCSDVFMLFDRKVAHDILTHVLRSAKLLADVSISS